MENKFNNENQKILAIIPARSGSKGLKQNILRLNKKPLVNSQ